MTERDVTTAKLKAAMTEHLYRWERAHVFGVRIQQELETELGTGTMDLEVIAGIARGLMFANVMQDDFGETYFQHAAQVRETLTHVIPAGEHDECGIECPHVMPASTAPRPLEHLSMHDLAILMNSGDQTAAAEWRVRRSIERAGKRQGGTP